MDVGGVSAYQISHAAVVYEETLKEREKLKKELDAKQLRPQELNSLSEKLKQIECTLCLYAR